MVDAGVLEEISGIVITVSTLIAIEGGTGEGQGKILEDKIIW